MKALVTVITGTVMVFVALAFIHTCGVECSELIAILLLSVMVIATVYRKSKMKPQRRIALYSALTCIVLGSLSFSMLL